MPFKYQVSKFFLNGNAMFDFIKNMILGSIVETSVLIYSCICISDTLADVFRRCLKKKFHLIRYLSISVYSKQTSIQHTLRISFLLSLVNEHIAIYFRPIVLARTAYTKTFCIRAQPSAKPIFKYCLWKISTQGIRFCWKNAIVEELLKLSKAVVVSKYFF